MNDRVSGKHIEKAGDITTPVLPTEVWLQILENISDPEYLWTTVRQVSLRYKAYVERIFANVYLPQITVSLSLPRRDPSTDALLWAESIPGAQMTLEFAAIEEKWKLMTLVSPTALDYGAHTMSIEILRSNGNLSKHRLDAATAWICIGSNRAKGVSVNMPRSMDWDEDRHVWAWKVNWRKFVSAFYAERRLKREQNQASRRVPTRRREQHVRRR